MMPVTTLDENESLVVEMQRALCEYVSREVEQRAAAGDNLTKSVRLLYNRIGCTATSMYVLRLNASHDWAVDGTSLLRTMYDACLQLLWILHDPTQRNQRATDYLEFYAIEAHDLRSRLDSSGTDLGDQLARSSKRAENDRQLDAALRSVGARFLTKAGQRQHAAIGDAYLTDPEAKYQKNWYPEDSLRSLAEGLGYLHEYRITQKDTSASVHGSALALLTKPTISTEWVLHWALALSGRAAGAIAEAFNIPLDMNQTEIVQIAKQNLYDNPDTENGGER